MDNHECSVCKKNTNDVSVSCAICLQSFHAKCIGIKGKDADKLIAIPGLCYYCEKHRKISGDVLHWKIIKLEKTFKSLVAILSELQNIFDFDVSDIEKMSDGFSNIDRLLHQPHDTEHLQLIQRQQDQIINQQLQLQQMQLQLSDNDDLQRIQQDHQYPKPVDDQPKQQRVPADQQKCQHQLHDQHQKQNPQQLKLQSLEPQQTNINARTLRSKKKVILPVTIVTPNTPLNNVPSSPPLPTSTDNPPLTSDVCNRSPGSAISVANLPSPSDCTLRVVPPPFVVFLSRLEYGTKPNDIMNYLANKGIDTSSIRCQSLTPANLPGRLSASFKLIAPTLIGKTIVNPNFWPSNMIVKEFSNRPRSKSSKPKN